MTKEETLVDKISDNPYLKIVAFAPHLVIPSCGLIEGVGHAFGDPQTTFIAEHVKMTLAGMISTSYLMAMSHPRMSFQERKDRFASGAIFGVALAQAEYWTSYGVGVASGYALRMLIDPF